MIVASVTKFAVCLLLHACLAGWTAVHARRVWRANRSLLLFLLFAGQVPTNAVLAAWNAWRLWNLLTGGAS